MADELVFYTHPMSRGRIVRWMLEEIGQPYRTELLEYGTTMKAPAYLAVNPMGKVPAIRHGDTVVTEAAAICAYLADAFPEPRLAPPPGDRRRGPYYRWLFFGAGPLEAAWTNRAHGLCRAAGAGEDGRLWTLRGESMTRSKRRCRAANMWSATVSPPPMSISAPASASGMQFGMIEKRPAFERYWQRLSARPAALRAKEIDDALST